MQASSPENSKEDEPIELLQLAQKRFMQWHQKKEAERADRTRAIQSECLSPQGRAVRRLKLWEEILTEDSRQRCEIYRDVALENNSFTMISQTNLDGLKDQIMTVVHHAQLALKQCNANDFFSAGNYSPVTLSAVQDRVDLQLQVSILAVANAEIDVHRSEGAVWRKTGFPPEARAQETAKDRLLDNKTEVDLKTAAAYLGKSLQHVRRLAHDGVLSVTRSTRPKMVRVASVRWYLRPGKIVLPVRRDTPNAHNAHFAYFPIFAVCVSIELDAATISSGRRSERQDHRRTSPA
jgi:hypothetical protein